MTPQLLDRPLISPFPDKEKEKRNHKNKAPISSSSPSPCSFSAMFSKLESFRVSLDSSSHQTHPRTHKLSVSSLNVSVPSMLRQHIMPSDSDEDDAPQAPHLIFASQVALVDQELICEG